MRSNLKIYHGSIIQNLKYIEPKITGAYKNEGPIVFGSHKDGYVAAYCIHWNDNDLTLQTNSSKLVNRQPDENFFESITLIIKSPINFNNPCSIYELEDSGFKYFKYFHNLEMVSINKAKVLKEIKFNNFNDVIKKYNIEIINKI